MIQRRGVYRLHTRNREIEKVVLDKLPGSHLPPPPHPPPPPPPPIWQIVEIDAMEILDAVI